MGVFLRNISACLLETPQLLSPPSALRLWQLTENCLIQEDILVLEILATNDMFYILYLEKKLLREIGIYILDEHCRELGYIMARFLFCENQKLSFSSCQFRKSVISLEINFVFRARYEDLGTCSGCFLPVHDGRDDSLGLFVKLVDKVSVGQRGILCGLIWRWGFLIEQGVIYSIAVNFSIS